jgi:hypothetical protein
MAKQGPPEKQQGCGLDEHRKGFTDYPETRRPIPENLTFSGSYKFSLVTFL